MSCLSPEEKGGPSRSHHVKAFANVPVSFPPLDDASKARYRVKPSLQTTMPGSWVVTGEEASLQNPLGIIAIEDRPRVDIQDTNGDAYASGSKW